MSDQINLETVINDALALIGDVPLSLDDETPEAGAANSIATRVMRTCLSRQNWTFATRTLRLSRDESGEAGYQFGYDYVFLLPGGRLGPPLAVMRYDAPPGALLREWRCEHRWLFSDHDDLAAAFMFEVDPEFWPPVFRDCVTNAIASDLAIGRAQNLPLAERLRQVAYGTPGERGRGGLMGQAIAMEAAGTLNRGGLAESPIETARWS